MEVSKISICNPSFSSGYARLKRPFSRSVYLRRKASDSFFRMSEGEKSFRKVFQCFKVGESGSVEKVDANVIKQASLLVSGLMIRQENIENRSKKKEGKWVEILSYQNDKENFAQNVDLLKELSHGNWQTKTYNADVNLRRGDFHVYMVDGEPKVGIRFLEEFIYEIMGTNGSIPVKYFDEIKKHIENCSLTGLALKEFMNCKAQKEEAERVRKDISGYVKEDNLPAILNYLGKPYELLPNGNVILLSDFGSAGHYYDWEDIGVDVNKIFEKVIKVCGDVKISDSQLKSFGQLSKIEGDLYLVGSTIKTLGENLREVGGSLHLQNSKLEDLGALERVGKIARFSGSNVTSLGNVCFIGKDLILLDSLVSDLGNLERVEGALYCTTGTYSEEEILSRNIYVKEGVFEV